MSSAAAKLDLPLSETTSRLARDVEMARRQAVGDRLTEEAIQAAVIQHLELRAKPGVVFFHVPNGGMRSKSEAGRFKAIGVVAGAPDLLLFADNQSYALELKASTGKLSESQRLMLQRLAAAGVKTKTAYGLNEALGAIHQWGLFKP